jgi:ferredoxin/flavodoxin---NADP+ reductase
MVRYAVAPDHPRTQSITSALGTVLAHPSVRFLGNVAVGTDVTLVELARHYDAIVVATGAATDRRMGIPGEDLPGSISASDLVAWYCGHPDAAVDRFRFDAHSVAVVGAGNVAGDVARMLARTPDELGITDAPDHVLSAFASSQVRDVHLLSRRGPAQTKFTTRELRELSELADADVLVDPVDLDLDPVSEEAVRASPAVRRNVEVMRSWAGATPSKSRRVQLRFFQRPVELLGDSQVTGIRLERTALDPEGVLQGTGQMTELPVQLVVRAVGYRTIPLAGLPFDDASGVVPHLDGRVLRDGVPVPGVYVAGWAKRGPVGVIGSNKHDARETVRSLLADAPELPPAPVRDPDALPGLLRERGVAVVTWDGWQAIDRTEQERGREQGRERAKIADRAEMLRIAAEGYAAVGGPPT